MVSFDGHVAITQSAPSLDFYRASLFLDHWTLRSLWNIGFISGRPRDQWLGAFTATSSRGFRTSSDIRIDYIWKWKHAFSSLLLPNCRPECERQKINPRENVLYRLLTARQTHIVIAIYTVFVLHLEEKLFNKNRKFLGKYYKGSFLEVCWNFQCIAAILWVDTLALKWRYSDCIYRYSDTSANEWPW